MILNTPDLILRPFLPQDTAPFIALNQDPLVMEYMPQLLSEQESLNFLDNNTAHWKTHTFGRFACILKEKEAFIGCVGLIVPSFQAHFMPAISIEWRIASEYWGKGYATQAAQEVLKYAFATLDLAEIVSFTVIGNAKSERVMQKLGMNHDPKDNFEHPKLPQDHKLRYHVLYRLTKKEWQQKLSFAKMDTPV